MSLEVDRRDDLPIPHQPQKEVFDYRDHKSSHYYAYPTVDGLSPKPTIAQERAFRRSPVLFLTIALAVMTILAAVAAGIGGSIATSRKNQIDDLRRSLRNANHQLDSENGTSRGNAEPVVGNNNSSCANTSTSDPTLTPSEVHLQPTTNCTAIGDGKRYVSSFFSSAFTVQCETDFPDYDILGIWMFTFADCIEACASWNDHQNSPRCYGVSYDISDAFTEQRGIGNCFLKGSGSIVAHVKNVTSSATAQISSGS